jgi:outer membrane protein TolC
MVIAGPLAALDEQAILASGELLSLDEAISLASRDNRLVNTASIGVLKADEQLAALSTRRLPSVSLNVLGLQQLTPINFIFERGVFGTYPGIGPVPATNTSISTPAVPTAFIIGHVDQPLSQLYRIGLGMNQLRLNGDLAREGQRQKRHEIIQNVKQVYFAILQAQSGLHAANEAVKLYREIDRVTGEYLTQQVALKADSLDVKMNLAKAEYEADTLGDQLTKLKEQLNQLLGRSVLTEFSVLRPDEPAGYEMDLSSARARAVELRPEVSEARIRVKQAEGDRRVKRSEFIPDVSLSFLYISPRNFSGFIPKNIAGLGLTLKWEVFDWGRKRHELAEKDLAIQQAKNALAETESSVLIDVGDKFRKLKQTRRQLQIAQLSQESSAEKVRVTANRYRFEASLMKDVLLSQTSLEQANHQYQQALLAFWTAKAEFAKAIGEDK